LTEIILRDRRKCPCGGSVGGDLAATGSDRYRVTAAVAGKMVKPATGPVPTEHWVSDRCQPGGNGVFNGISLRFLLLYHDVRVYVSGLGRNLSPILRHGWRCLRKTYPQLLSRHEFALSAMKVSHGN
jgi:hypothetical protein